MTAPKRARRNTLAHLAPLTPAIPEISAPVQDWERFSAAQRKSTLKRQLITANGRINSLCATLRDVFARVDDLSKRLRFVENAAKLKAGPR
jgi:hypothetical protein